MTGRWARSPMLHLDEHERPDLVVWHTPDGGWRVMDLDTGVDICPRDGSLIRSLRAAMDVADDYLARLDEADSRWPVN